MNNDVILQADGVSKKFCRSLKHAMWYGCGDIFRDTIGMRTRSDQLRGNEFWAVDDVSFELHKGECLGLVGPNGAGKSTLFKMLNGILRPDRGTIRYRGRMGALIEVGAGFHPQLTGRENIYVNGAILGMSRHEINRKLDAIIAFADIGDFLETPIRFYSSGMMVRLGMAVAVHTEPEILLIDEVFAVGDMNFQAKCFNKIGLMRRHGTTFILVSHNIHHVASFSDRVVVMDHGRNLAEGLPEETLQTYVNLMISKRRQEQATVEDLPTGTGRVRILKAGIFGEDGEPVNHVQASQPFNLVIEYESSGDYEDAEVDIGVWGGNNSVLFRVTNRYTRQTVSIRQGNGILRVHFPCIPVNNDRLNITTAVWSQGREELFDRHAGVGLRVQGCSLSSGALWVECDFDSTAEGYCVVTSNKNLTC